MSLPAHPIMVMADGLDVVCRSCGATWARGMADTDAATALAGRMNADPMTQVPEANRARRGLCHGAGTGSKWSPPGEKGSPGDWADRLIVAEMPAALESEPILPVWQTALLATAVLGYLVAKAPGAALRGLFKLRLLGAWGLGFVALAVFLELSVPGIAAGTAWLLTQLAVLAGVLVFLVVCVALAVYAVKTMPRVQQDEDGTVVKPVSTGHTDRSE